MGYTRTEYCYYYYYFESIAIDKSSEKMWISLGFDLIGNPLNTAVFMEEIWVRVHALACSSSSDTIAILPVSKSVTANMDVIACMSL